MEKGPKKPLAAFYDEHYAENENMFNEGRPEAFILDIADQVPEGGQVLEYGAGQGRNALALAERGLSVRAIDISPVGVASMTEASEKKGLTTFTAEVGDAQGELEGTYDLIVSTFMIHHLSREDALHFIEKIKTHTKDGGMNAIAAFTDAGDFAKVDKDHFYLALEELKNLYSGWEILSYTERKNKAKATHDDGSPMFNVSARIAAKKPGGN